MVDVAVVQVANGGCKKDWFDEVTTMIVGVGIDNSNDQN